MSNFPPHQLINKSPGHQPAPIQNADSGLCKNGVTAFGRKPHSPISLEMRNSVETALGSFSSTIGPPRLAEDPHLRAKPGPRSLSRASCARLFYSSALVPEGHLVIARRFNAGTPGPLSQVPKGRLKSNQNPTTSNPKILVSRLHSSGLLAHSSATKRCQAHQGGKYFVPETAKTLESLGKSAKMSPIKPKKTHSFHAKSSHSQIQCRGLWTVDCGLWTVDCHEAARNPP